MKETTSDGFLGQALTIRQPQKGHRSGTDAVLLAASIEVEKGTNCLELGSGAGVASLCVAHRFASLTDTYFVTGIEIDSALVELAQENAVANGLARTAKFVSQDIHTAFDAWALPPSTYDQVFANPPFYPEGSTAVPPDAGKKTAHIAQHDTLEIWVKRAASLLKAKGYLTLIHCGEALPEILAAMHGRFGGIEVKTLHPSEGQTASRVLIRGQRDSKAAVKLYPPLFLHSKSGDYTDGVTDILRHGGGLVWSR